MALQTADDAASEGHKECANEGAMNRVVGSTVFDSIELAATAIQSSTMPELSAMWTTVHSFMSVTQSSVATTMSSGTVEEFLLFPKLPIELRLKIWKHALPGPRIVEVCYDCRPDNKNRDALRTNLPPPILLHVWQGSREATLKVYSKLGNDSLGDDFTFIDFAEDTLFMLWISCRTLGVCGLEAPTCTDVLNPKAITSLKHVAIDISMLEERDCPPNVFECYQGLKKVTVVVHGGWDLSPEHEQWRMKETGIGFIDLEDIRETWKAVCLQKVRKQFSQWKEMHLEHEGPDIDFRARTMTRAGKRCCSLRKEYDEDHEDDEDDGAEQEDWDDS